ncbi:RHS repeat-associated core domain-containing protein [Leptolyngbyaceae cyanobacterium CCMR0081]|uniref:RHS repeat-associated core domain-containing protein n=1 Tax=Adonisia turfae CCMR0081 TaxID=2292702 RepID=A0A6M0RHV4_9CYAN|nr:RHS repeat-associated core domain-containing protein [Adonisia turfae CCMR0081]
MYYRARYYDPTVDRFISENPLGFDAGDANLYRYVFNSPTNYTDPSGEATFVPLIVVGAVLALVTEGVLLNNQLQSEETREALEDFAQWCLETATGGYNPDFDPNRPIWDNLPLPKVDWDEILQTPPVNLEDLYPGGFGEEIQDLGSFSLPPFGSGLDSVDPTDFVFNASEWAEGVAQHSWERHNGADFRNIGINSESQLAESVDSTINFPDLIANDRVRDDATGYWSGVERIIVIEHPNSSSSPSTAFPKTSEAEAQSILFAMASKMWGQGINSFHLNLN